MVMMVWNVIVVFYSASTLLAMQSAVLARAILSVHHVPVLCPHV